jgi:methylmalonyl-CoA mutase
MNAVAESRIHGAPAVDRPLRFVTAASLFDGHDAAINLIRRLLIAQGAEVVHLGHNRSVSEIVHAALCEDADAVAVSSYQGGHMEYFRYMLERLKDANAGDILLFVGGGGTISAEERAALEADGVAKVYSPADGMRLGLKGMIEDMFARVRALGRTPRPPVGPIASADVRRIGEALEWLNGVHDPEERARLVAGWRRQRGSAVVLGVTGPGGAGKSSLVDELLLRFALALPHLRQGVLAIDPTRERTGGALLGDRIRMNSLNAGGIFMHSVATRGGSSAATERLGEMIDFLRTLDFDLIWVETAGAGQADAAVAGLADATLYVMTAEYGGVLQLEKLAMLDHADWIALNKFEKSGSQDALRDVARQWRRNHEAFSLPDEEVPVYATLAARVQDPGVNRLFRAICSGLQKKHTSDTSRWAEHVDWPVGLPDRRGLIPETRRHYLSEIAERGRSETRTLTTRVVAAARAQHCYEALGVLEDPVRPEPLEPYPPDALAEEGPLGRLRRAYAQALDAMGEETRTQLRNWDALLEERRRARYAYTVRDKTLEGDNYTRTLSGLEVPKVALPRFASWAERVDFLGRENFPGSFPYTAGVYPYRRTEEDPTRMFAGEGTPERTNRRFHYLARAQKAVRLSTAFDSATLYGEDPDPRPDIYGRIGNSGVSVATLDDMKRLYSGFDLLAPSTSVSMTINGPAPILLAMFLNTAIDRHIETVLRSEGRLEQALARVGRSEAAPVYRGARPEGHDGGGLALLGLSGADLLDPDEYARRADEALAVVRGTVQADILKEDQAQNTCIFSTEFALRLMGDVQQYFIDHRVRNFYSVSVSGYHIAEAGANPITQLAFTLANGFTLVEYYRARGMDVDDFAPNFSFFFSNGMDAEYAVLGRVARRIWARAMRDVYGAGSRSQMLKYHIQTSGRSLHAQEIQFNDIRTTLQALYALYDNCQSLHTNAYDEALTTPTEESVRRALAIQLIINRELGLHKNENPLQGSFVIDALTDLVEAEVYREFDRLSERGGVLGAMETMYQRGKIQEESLLYERRKHDGSLPIVGVNTFLPPAREAAETPVALIRSTEEEKQAQIEDLRAFHARHAADAPAALERLKTAARRGENTFAVLMEAVRCCSLGQITHAFYEVGGRYRRAL